MMMSITTTQESSSAGAYMDKSQCRTCLAAMDRDQHYLFEQVAIGDDMVQTASIIMACASVQILVDDFYPQYICRTCLNEGINSYAFRSKCELSQHRLLEASHVGTLKVETTTHLPTLQPHPSFKQETIDAYETEENISRRRSSDNNRVVSDEDDYLAGDAFGGEVSSDDEVLAKRVPKRAKRSTTRAATTASRKRKSITPPRPLLVTPASQQNHLCRQCDQVFPTRPAFIAHRDTHASFICRWCVTTGTTKMAFVSYETLLSHMRKKHKAEYQRQGDMMGMKEEEEEDVAVAKKKRKVVTKAKKAVGRKGKRKIAAEEDDDDDDDDGFVKIEDMGGADEGDENEEPSEDDPHRSFSPTAHQCHLCYKYYTSATTLTSHIPLCQTSSSNVDQKTLAAAGTPGKFTCNVCSRHFRTFRAVTEHKRTHKGGVFCPYCGLHMLARGMANHRKREHGAEIDVVCEGCNGVYKGVDELDTHLITHKSFACPDCTFTTKYIDDYRLHQMTHELQKFAESENGKCRECGEQTEGILALLEHYQTHTMVTCQECETNYLNMVHLNRHAIKAHSDIDTTIPEDKRVCTVCAKQFLTVEGMWQHRAKHNAETGKDGETTEELFCAYCDFRPKSNVSLGKHMQEEHHSQKTETCTVCDKSFFSAGKLKVHMLTHNADKQHVCEVCGAGFALKGNLNVHMRVHTGEKPYKCEICGASNPCKKHQNRNHYPPGYWVKCPTCSNMFAKKELSAHITEEHLASSHIKYIICPLCSCEVLKPSLADHINTEHKDLPPRLIYTKCKATVDTCRKCSKVFRRKFDLRGHLENVHSYKTCVPCNNCEQVISWRYLERHIVNMHVDQEVKIPCPICKTVTNKAKLLKHINTTHKSLSPEKMVKKCGSILNVCPICSKVFKEKYELKRHITNVHGSFDSKSPKFACLICSKEIYGRDRLRDHIQRHERQSFHGKKIHDTEIFIRRHDDPRVPCPLCGVEFVKSYLKKHMRFIHIGDRPYGCEICGKSFKENHILTMHISNIHSETRPPPKFVCSHCGKAFVRISNYKDHVAIHSDERPYGCETCGSRFKVKQELMRHNRTHANIRPYICSVCAKAFSRKHHLTVHMRGHTGERPYPCPLCGKAFMQNCVLKSHIKAAHSVPDPN